MYCARGVYQRVIYFSLSLSLCACLYFHSYEICAFHISMDIISLLCSLIMQRSIVKMGTEEAEEVENAFPNVMTIATPATMGFNNTFGAQIAFVNH